MLPFWGFSCQHSCRTKVLHTREQQHQMVSVLNCLIDNKELIVLLYQGSVTVRVTRVFSHYWLVMRPIIATAESLTAGPWCAGRQMPSINTQWCESEDRSTCHWRRGPRGSTNKRKVQGKKKTTWERFCHVLSLIISQVSPWFHCPDWAWKH